MSIVLNVHPGVQLYSGNVYPGGQQKKSYCCSITEGTSTCRVAFNGSGLEYKSFQDWAEISKA